MAYDDFEDKSFKVDDNYFKVVIPDLDPGKSVPVQFRWQYADQSYGAWSVSKILEVPEISRPEATNIVATWIQIETGIALQIVWDAPELTNGFAVYLTSPAQPNNIAVFTQSRDKNSTSQKIIIPIQWIKDNFAGIFVTNLNGVLKSIYIDNATTGQTFTIPVYNDPLQGSVIPDNSWKITQVDKGFSVTWDAVPTVGTTYWETTVETSPNSTGPFVGRGSARNAPVFVAELNQVWVRIAHRLITGGYSQYSNAKTAEPYVPIIDDTTPPNEVIVNSALWSGTDLVINYTMPTTDPGARFEIILTKVVDGVTKTGRFADFFPAQTGTHNFIIKGYGTERASIQSQFGTLYQSFTGKFISVDASENPTTGTTFTTGTLTNPGTGVVPTFTATGTLNGYTVSWTQPDWAQYTYIHQSDTSGFTPSLANRVYTGNSPAIIQTTSNTFPFARKYIKIFYVTNIINDDNNPATPLDYFTSEPSAEGFVDPVNPDSTDTTPPPPVTSVTGVGSSNNEDPSGLGGLITLTITQPTMPADFKGYSVKIVNGSITTYEDFPSTTPLTTLVIKNGIYVGQSYTVSVATKDVQNTQTYITATPNPIPVNDSRTNTTVVTGLVVSATDSIATVRWTAPNDVRVGSYRVLLTTNADTTFLNPIQTINTDSTQTSFGGLAAATTYRVRVTTRLSNNGTISTQNVDTSFTLNASGAISDGIKPSQNPTPTVKSLFKAFALYWDAIDNADAVTYEVYAKTVNGTGIVDPANLVMEIDGTFAVINALASGAVVEYPAETSPTSATDYYFAIRAKDEDGLSTAAVVTVGPFTASRTGRFDIATNAIYANHITAGEIDASKMVTDLLFTNKTINVGQSTSLNRIRLDAVPGTISGQSVASRIFIGSGNYDDAGTSFYADNVGRFSIKDKLKFDGTNLTIDANGKFGGLLQAGPTGQSVKIGLDAGGSTLHGIYLESPGDYLYNNGNLRLAAGRIEYPVGGALKITANLDVVGSSTITGSFGVTGTGSSIYAGTAASGVTRVVLNKDGLFGYRNSGGVDTINFSFPNSTGLFQLGAGDLSGWTVNGGVIEKSTSTTINGVTANTYAGISTGSLAFYAGGGAGGSGTPQFSVSQAGAVTARNISIFSNGAAPTAKLIDAGSFFVQNNGYMEASNAKITGEIRASTGVFTGTVDVGDDANTAGVLRIVSGSGVIRIGRNALINGSVTAAITASAGSTTNFYVRASDGYMFSQSGQIGGWNIGTSDLKSGSAGTTVALSSSGTYAMWAGAASAFDGTNYAPFSVTNAGQLRATGAIISGQITVSSGRIGSQTTGWNINSGQLESFGTSAGGTQLVLDSSTGNISGGAITGAKVFSSSFFIGNNESGDKIQANGTLVLAGGLIRYSGGVLEINPDRLNNNSFKIKLNATSNEDGTYGDSTLVQSEDGELTIGRALFYGGLTDPRTGNGGFPVTTRQQVAGGAQGSAAFLKGDLWLQRA